MGATRQTSLFEHWSAGVVWADVRVGDFDGDGRADIAGRYAESGEWFVGRSTGAAFITALWERWSTATVWTDTLAENFV